MKRAKQVPLALLLGALWGNAWSAGFGELVVRSRLGEPLRAEITVRATPEELRSLSARIADPDYFRQVGVPYSNLVQQIDAKLVRDGSRAKIVLSSRVPVREPFVNVLLDMSWSSGRLVREFPILLDPPEVAAPARPVPAAGRDVALEPSRGAPVTQRQPDRWTVRPGETLYGIARQVAPAGTSPEQTLVALWRANPDAFIGGDVNRLKAGVTLRTPSAEEIRQISLAEARALLRSQARRAAPVAAQESTQQAPGGLEERVDRGAVVAREDLGQGSAAEPEDRLKVGASPEPMADGEIPALPSPEVSALQETLAASEAALGEANERIVRLEAEIARLQKLVETQNASLARMQAQVERMTEAEQGSMLSSILPWFGGALAALAAALGWSAYRRRREAQALPAPAPEPLHAPTLSAAAAASTLEHSGPATESGRAVTSGQNIDTSSILGTDFTQVAFNALHADEGVDPVAEAEVYLAYGRDPQAEEILLDALKQTPRRPAIYLKLLEVYAKRGDRAKFDQYLRTLSELSGEQGADWDMALSIGKRAWPADERFASVLADEGPKAEIPPRGSFPEAGGLSGVAAASGSARPDVRSEPSAAVPAETGESSETTRPDSAQEFVELDFDLDKLSQRMAEEPVSPAYAAPEKTPPAGGGGDLLEFDLELPVTEPEQTKSPENVSFDESQATKSHRTAAVEKEEAIDFPELILEEEDVQVQKAGAKPDATDSPSTGIGDLKEMLDEIDFDLAEVSPESEKTTRSLAEDGAESLSASATAEAQKIAEAGPPTDVMDIDLERFAAEGSGEDHATRLQLAQAYLEMGDLEGARELLEEVLRDGSEAQRATAQQLMDRIQAGKA
ncbi:FimV/HubP family polar landmark protein [Tepidiphilus olei]|uniref:FimV/HubP family polar landmark protein n=1 Tax=Tepidiphilus olei TaxID=2502184 RepID=UPI00115E54A1|nr:FimV/HubP family polar landmark protein [Tepidiphilus olei]